MGKIVAVPALLLAFVSCATAQSQIFMGADSTGDAYKRITSMGYILELPDCIHPVRHITEQWDGGLKEHVFAFTLHKDIDNDRCKNFDRQRCEITTDTLASPATMRGELGETHTYRWKFKLDSGFQASPMFCHIHQIKAGNGPQAGAPIITITPRYGTPDKLQVIYTAPKGEQGSGVVAEVDLAPFKGTWVEAIERVKYEAHGSIDLTLRRVSDDSLMLHYSNPDIILWRPGATWNKPKWGLYRSLKALPYLRDESVLFADIYLAEGETLPAPPVPTALRVASPSSSVVHLSWSCDSVKAGQFRVERSMDGNRWSFLGMAKGEVRSYDDTNIGNQFLCYYRIRSENAGGNSAYSNTAKAK
ncbi:MAG TPA: fibronectin type III domain-containing protein [Bacteroidota bacterium]|nr:fibronectin type III domain-containing protein [Bacteroidota bacterium]